ncbi:hypothetical protein U1Q18_005024, partial [Sarracenia purpurea var. burkii]
MVTDETRDDTLEVVSAGGGAAGSPPSPLRLCFLCKTRVGFGTPRSHSPFFPPFCCHRLSGAMPEVTSVVPLPPLFSLFPTLLSVEAGFAEAV